ncbi:MAG TPA: hypothetical protein VGV89_03795 [Thermoplasmata archaeon]|nr:hypothetical protein [Thermoplasmata archaeon]
MHDLRVSVSERRAARRGWDRWWREAARVPELREAFRERERRHSEHPSHATLPLSAHTLALQRARFREVQVIWQNFDDRILCAFR